MKTPFDILEFFVETEDKDTGLGKIDRLTIHFTDTGTTKTYDNTVACQEYVDDKGQTKVHELYDLKAHLNIYLNPNYEVSDASVERTHHPKIITFHLYVSDKK